MNELKGKPKTPAMEDPQHFVRYPGKRRRPWQQRGGWVVSELAGLAGVSVRTVRHYVTRQLLARPEFFGRQTRYDRLHLLRLLAVPLLKARGIDRLHELQRELDTLGESGLTALLESAPLPAATRAALGFPEANVSAAEMNAHRADPTPPRTLLGGVETWQRVTLLPGLELTLRSDATPFVRDVAERIRQQYATG